MLDSVEWRDYETRVRLYVAAAKNAYDFRQSRPLHEANSEYYAPQLEFARRNLEEAFDAFLTAQLTGNK